MERKVKAWMPLYVSDFLIATLGWEADAVGHYIRLLAIQWDKGSIPSDPEQWEALSHGVNQHREMLEEKFPISADGFRRNLRLEEERLKAQKVYSKKVAAGREGAKKRWGGGEVDSSSSQNPPPVSPRNAATLGQADARKAFDCAPVSKKQGWRSFFRLWKDVVLTQIEPDIVIKAFEDYYSSDQGKGKYARGPKRLLEDAVWEDDPKSWSDEQVDTTDQMAMLDKILDGG